MLPFFGFEFVGCILARNVDRCLDWRGLSGGLGLGWDEV